MEAGAEVVGLCRVVDVWGDSMLAHIAVGGVGVCEGGPIGCFRGVLGVVHAALWRQRQVRLGCLIGKWLER